MVSGRVCQLQSIVLHMDVKYPSGINVGHGLVQHVLMVNEENSTSISCACVAGGALFEDHAHAHDKLLDTS